MVGGQLKGSVRRGSVPGEGTAGLSPPPVTVAQSEDHISYRLISHISHLISHISHLLLVQIEDERRLAGDGSSNPIRAQLVVGLLCLQLMMGLITRDKQSVQGN